MGTNYKFDTCRIQSKKDSTMSKKTEQITFRTTEENLKYVKSLAEMDDRTLGYVLNKLIDVFRKKGVALSVRTDDMV